MIKPALTLLLCAMAATAMTTPAHSAPAEAPRRIEIHYVPRTDLHRMAGYESEGLFMPLSELVGLARAAADTRADATAAPDGLFVQTLRLSGELGDSAGLSGALSYHTSSEQWSAVAIDDGAMLWTGQEPAPGAQAFLARVDGQTWLFARGSGEETLRLRAVLALEAPPSGNLDTGSAAAALALPRLFVPARFDVRLPERFRLRDADMPTSASGQTVTLWPMLGQPGRAWLDRSESLELGDFLRAELDRTVSVQDVGVLVEDRLVARDRFAQGHALQVSLPEGLTLLEVEGAEGTSIQVEGNQLRVVATADGDQLAWTARFAAPMNAGRGALGAWDLPALTWTSRLTTRFSNTHILTLTDPPAGLMPLTGDGAERRFLFHGPLPSLALRLARRNAPLSPDVRASAHIHPDHAVVITTMDLPDDGPHAVRFAVPADWLLVNGSVMVDGVPVPTAMEERSGGDWRIAWAPGVSASRSLTLTLRQSGLRFHDDGATSLSLPFLNWHDFMPAAHQMVVHWAPSLNARLTHARGVQTAPPTTVAGAPPPASRWNTLTLMASGPAPEAVLSLQALPPDLSATVTTALNVLDNTIETRVCLDFFVQLAPTSVFRFVLPAGTGSGVRIAGEALREQAMTSTAEGEQWTLVTQREALDDVRFTLEWTTPFQPGGAPAQAPRIALPDVTSLTGYLLVEGVHALRLDLDDEGLTETDQWELPPLPWPGRNRILAVYRHTTAPWDLTIGAERLPIQSAARMVAREARLSATVATDGGRLVRAEYDIAPGGADPFFEVTLPEGARLWSVLVNGEGVMPIRRSETEEDSIATPFLAPLPTRRDRTEDIGVTVIYRQGGAALDRSSFLEAQGPGIAIPVNRTIWTLRLPREFEVLAMGRDGRDRMTLAETTARYFRTAHYPSLILFADWPVGRAILAILFIMGTPAFIYLATVQYRRQRYAPPTDPSDTDGTPTHPRRRSLLWKMTVIALFILVAPFILLLLYVSPLLMFFALMAIFIFRWSPIGQKPERRDSTQATGSSDTGGVSGPPPPPPTNAPYPPGCLARALKLVAIAIVIIVLIIIAMPNFLEAQIRAKSSRVRADLRSLATGLESYRIDNNTFPTELSALTSGKVKHINEIFPDPYNPVPGTPYRYLVGPEAVEAARVAGLAPPDQELPDDFFILYSVGPDGVDHGGRLAYDWANPDRGGDIIRIRQISPAALSFKGIDFPSAPQRQQAMEDRAAPDGLALADMEMATEEAAAPPPPAEALEALQSQRMPSPGAPVSQMAGVDRPMDTSALVAAIQESAGQDELADEARAQYQGLLSMGIALPEEGIRREFTYLGHAETLRLRLLTRAAYLRLNHVIRMALFVALFGLWWFQRRWYWPAFYAVVAVALVAPVVVPTVWTVCANTALEGTLLSLLAPVVAWMLQRCHRELRALAGLAPLALLLVLAPSAQATDTETVRLIAPYDTVEQARRGDDLPAYLSREDFTRLWQAGRRLAPVADPAAPALMDYQLDAWVDLEAEQLHGTVALSACNLSSATATLELGLWDMGWSQWPDGWATSGARAVGATGGLTLVLPPQWRGVVSGQFTQPLCVSDDTLALSLPVPETASGAWRIRTSFADLELLDQRDGAVLIDHTPAGAVLSGPVRGDRLTLRWRAARSGLAPEGTDRDAAAVQQARLDVQVRWDHPGLGAWSARLTPPPGEALERSARRMVFFVDPELRLTTVAGGGLRRAIVRDLTDAEAEQTRAQGFRAPGRLLELELDGRTAAAITLEGVVTLPASPDGGDADAVWNVPTLRPLQGGGIPTNVHILVHRDLEILAVETEDIDPQPAPTDPTAPYAQRHYRTSQSDWTMAWTLKRSAIPRQATIRELVVPGDGAAWRFADILLTLPQGGVLEGAVILPPDFQVLTCQGDAVAAWVQIDDRLQVYLTAPAPEQVQFAISGRSVPAASARESALPTVIQPLNLRLAGAGAITRQLALFIPPDQEAHEEDIGTARARPPDSADQALATAHIPDHERTSGRLMAYTLSSARPLRFTWTAIDSAARYEILNQAIVSEGLETLEAQVQATARRGRLRHIAVDLLAPGQADRIASRIQAIGLSGQTRVDALGNGRYRFSAELPYPVAETVTFRLRVEWPLDPSAPDSIVLAAFVPATDGGSRAALLVRTAFDGALTPAPGTPLRAIDPASEPALRQAFVPLPADQAFELAADLSAPPRFLIERYERTESLQAVVESIRQHVVLSEDGVERNVLDIIVQNRSEQFLRVGLPHRLDRVQVYQVLVAGREAPVGATDDDGLATLTIPLIRPGLLDPEVAIRVAYVVDTGAPLVGSRSRRQTMPRVLGGLPVAESSMVLVLPATLQYGRFSGSMRQVDLLDLEAADAQRLASKALKLSEIALSASGMRQQRALTHLREFNVFAESQINEAMMRNTAQTRVYSYSAPDSRENLSLMRRASERDELLHKAQSVIGDNYMNVRLLEEMVEQQQALAPQQQARWAQQMAMPQEAPGVAIDAAPTVEPLVFPADGEVFAFRQLQGSGDVRFAHTGHEASQQRRDLAFAVVLALVVWALVFQWRRLFGTVERAAACVAIIALACLVFLVAIDLMAPTLAVSAFVWHKTRRGRGPVE